MQPDARCRRGSLRHQPEKLRGQALAIFAGAQDRQTSQGEASNESNRYEASSSSDAIAELIRTSPRESSSRQVVRAFAE